MGAGPDTLLPGPATVTVEIAQGARLRHEGRTLGAGRLLEVTEAQAGALEAAGTAYRLGRPRPRREPAQKDVAIADGAQVVWRGRRLKGFVSDMPHRDALKLREIHGADAVTVLD